MKIKLLIIVASVLLLVGCSETINEEFGYRLIKRNDEDCATALEVVYTDEQYEYGFGCLESDRYIIFDEDGSEYSIYDVIDEELLTIEELYELFDGHLYRVESTMENDVKNDVDYLEFVMDDLTIAKTEIMIDNGGYRNWPFDGYPEIIELEIDYQKVMNDFREIIEATDGIQVCNLGPMGCVLSGPMPAINIEFNDGINFYRLSIDVEDIEGNQQISVIRVMEGNETRLTIPSSELREEYNNIFEIVDNAYQEHLVSIE